MDDEQLEKQVIAIQAKALEIVEIGLKNLRKKAGEDLLRAIDIRNTAGIYVDMSRRKLTKQASEDSLQLLELLKTVKDGKGG